MTIDELRMLGRDCYAAFNQAAPDFSGRAWTLWAEMCAGIPVAASPFIRGKIIELDAMPRNFGKAVRQFGQEWRAAKSGSRFVFQLCPDCDKETPGFFSAWENLKNGMPHRFLIRCCCNNGKDVEGMAQMSKAGALKAGFLVVPANYDGGVLVYEAALLGTPSHNHDNRYIRAAENRNFKQRPAHRHAVAEAEGIW